MIDYSTSYEIRKFVEKNYKNKELIMKTFTDFRLYECRDYKQISLNLYHFNGKKRKQFINVETREIFEKKYDIISTYFPDYKEETVQRYLEIIINIVKILLYKKCIVERNSFSMNSFSLNEISTLFNTLLLKDWIIKNIDIDPLIKDLSESIHAIKYLKELNIFDWYISNYHLEDILGLKI